MIFVPPTFPPYGLIGFIGDRSFADCGWLTIGDKLRLVRQLVLKVEEKTRILGDVIGAFDRDHKRWIALKPIQIQRCLQRRLEAVI